ncbi:nucleoside-diphosphate kinase [Puteibacter caeruleilacunae]|nr:nucleoside-diphosphate kinase [Puteibacter caeruleilacunae]
MALDYTFTLIKPWAFSNNYTGPILKMVNERGFRIKALKMTHLTHEQAAEFYEVHKERPFFQELIDFMASGPIVVAIIEKDNAVEDFRKLIGATDPSEAASGTIRKMYAESKAHNAIHGSDSDESARIESDFFFAKSERF